MQSSASDQALSNVRILLGFDFVDLSPQAVRHERTREFKVAVQEHLSELLGPENLDRLCNPARPLAITSQETEDDEILRWATNELVECSGGLRASRIHSRCCLYVPPNLWLKCRGMRVHREEGRAVTALGALEKYRARVKDVPGQREQDELASMPLLLQVSWEAPL